MPSVGGAVALAVANASWLSATLASGYQRFALSLATRLAIWRLARSPRIDALVIDEGFGACDDEYLAGLALALESLASAPGAPCLIFVVSHVDALKDRVEHALEITVNKTSTMSSSSQIRNCDRLILAPEDKKNKKPAAAPAKKAKKEVAQAVAPVAAPAQAAAPLAAFAQAAAPIAAFAQVVAAPLAAFAQVVAAPAAIISSASNVFDQELDDILADAPQEIKMPNCLIQDPNEPAKVYCKICKKTVAAAWATRHLLSAAHETIAKKITVH